MSDAIKVVQVGAVGAAAAQASAAQANVFLSQIDVAKEAVDTAKGSVDTTKGQIDEIKGQIDVAKEAVEQAAAMSATHVDAVTTRAAEVAAGALAASSSATNAEAARAAAVVAQNNAVAVVTGGTGSLVAAAGKLPLAGANGRLDRSWLVRHAINDIGVPGLAGFGVGICPTLPAGYTPLPGCTEPSSGNYGNYQYSDGSVMIWIPAFWLRIGHAGNPTYGAYGVNSVDVKPFAHFPDQATAGAESYYLHRAFRNAGAVQPGVFRDKFPCSNNAGTASSIALAMPLVSAAADGNSTFSGLTGAPTNAYYGSIEAARTRGAQFFPSTVFIESAIEQLSQAHAQAATSATYCAWYDAVGVKNFPLGSNNNALKDSNDSTLTFASAGAAGTPILALTGSGSTLAKTTHNGQACGVADVNGNIWRIAPGVTCEATTKPITAATQASPVVLTVAGHGITTGTAAMILSVGGMTQINDRMFTVTAVDENTLSLDGVDGTAFSAFTVGGTITAGRFYVLKESADMTAVTSGASSATDLWGAAGVVVLYDEIFPNFATAYPNNGLVQRYGNAAGAVYDMSTAAARALTMSSMPAAGGISTSGSNAMGQDYHYQYVRNQLCVIVGGSWNSGSVAGVRARFLFFTRTNANNSVGFAAASYLP